VRYSPYQHYSSFNFISVGWACSYLGPYSPPKGNSPRHKIQIRGVQWTQNSKMGKSPEPKSKKDVAKFLS
jgi:hypothetical protein